MKWFLARKVEYFPFEVALVNDGYTSGRNPVFKWYFKNVFFYFANGFELSFRSKKDMEELRVLFREKLDEQFVKTIGSEIRASADKFKVASEGIFKNKDCFRKKFDNFRDAYINLFSIFQLPDLAQILVPEKDEKLLEIFGMDRDYAAKMLSEVDMSFREKISGFFDMPKELILMMLPDELKEFMETKKLPRDLKKRKTCVIMTLNGDTKVYWNEEADNIFYEEYKKHVKINEKEIKGQMAYKGLVQGKVYIAENEEEFKNIPENCILICSMTRYNIVPYMKKVKGIVTDQGGITCHAAIISRELKVPTIVGTRKATEVFKTGDIVEVDATHGVVKKIK